MRRAPRRNPATAVVPAPLVRPDGGPVAAGADGAGDVDLLPHASSHHAGGSDAIKLDDLAAPDDNTDLNASTTVHGLLRKLSNVATEFLNGQGAWTTPASSTGGPATRVVPTGATVTIADAQSLVVADYYAVEGTGTLAIEGDGAIAVL